MTSYNSIGTIIEKLIEITAFADFIALIQEKLLILLQEIKEVRKKHYGKRS